MEDEPLRFGGVSGLQQVPRVASTDNTVRGHSCSWPGLRK